VTSIIDVLQRDYQDTGGWPSPNVKSMIDRSVKKFAAVPKIPRVLDAIMGSTFDSDIA
jgi:hypothetical protein